MILTPILFGIKMNVLILEVWNLDDNLWSHSYNCTTSLNKENRMKYTVGDVVVCVEKKCEKYGFNVAQHL